MKPVLFTLLVIGCAEPTDSECTGAECGTRFLELGEPQRVAAGTRYTPTTSSAIPSDVTVTSSDRSILDAVVKDGAIELTSHRAGEVVLTATVGDQPLDTLEVAAVPVDAIDVFYRAVPGHNAPVTSFAAIAGSSDELCVTYRDSAGRPLPGLGQFAFSNDAIDALLIGESSRHSDGFAGPTRSTCIGLRFRHAGETTLIATAGELSTSTVFTVDATQPASSELAFMALHDWSLQAVTEAIDVDDIGGVNLISKAADGRYLLGVDATWKITGASTLFVGTHELAFIPEGAEPITVTATAAGVEITNTIRTR